MMEETIITQPDEKAKEQAAANLRERNIAEIDARINRTNEAAKRLEDANKKAEEVAMLNADIISRNILGGRTEAGQPLQVVKEESPRDYAKRLMNGEAQ